MRVHKPEQMEFDLEARTKSKTRLAQPRERIAKNVSGRKRDRLSVTKKDVAQKPAGLFRPGENAEALGIRNHEKIAAAFHGGKPKSATGGEHRKDGPV